MSKYVKIAVVREDLLLLLHPAAYYIVHLLPATTTKSKKKMTNKTIEKPNQETIKRYKMKEKHKRWIWTTVTNAYIQLNDAN